MGVAVGLRLLTEFNVVASTTAAARVEVALDAFSITLSACHRVDVIHWIG